MKNGKIYSTIVGTQSVLNSFPNMAVLFFLRWDKNIRPTLYLCKNLGKWENKYLLNIVSK